jgi:hypothetical protein
MSTLRAVYDLSRNPPTYDVVAFLMGTESARQRRGDDDIELEIWPGPVQGFAGDKLWPPPEQRDAMVESIVIPMALMLPTVRTVRRRVARPADARGDLFGLGVWSVGLARILEALKAGVRPLRPVGGVPSPDPSLVTITLREAEHWPARNSRVAEWMKAAEQIRASGFEVVFIRDTRKADMPLDGFATNPEASRDLDVRAQLYCEAVCNLFVSNGPAWFALALDAPVLMLRPTTEGVGKHSSQAWFDSVGLTRGVQIPGAPAWQRLVWEMDDADKIVAAFKAYIMDSETFRRAA